MADLTEYCTRQDVEDVYGGSNIRDWADLDALEDHTKITARITWARLRAFRRINARLQRRNFAIPFTDETPLPGVIMDIAADLAGYYLYYGRMLDDEDRTRDNLRHKFKEAERVMDEIIKGEIILDAAIQDNTDAPFVRKSS